MRGLERLIVSSEPKPVYMSVFELVGSPFCVTSEDGERLYSLLVSHFRNEDVVTLDFEGIKVCASPFFNTAIGRLLAEITDSASFHRFLHWEHLSPSSERLLKTVIENAHQYWSKMESLGDEIQLDDSNKPQ